MVLVKVLPKGQITIPKIFRENLGLKDGDFLQMEKIEDVIVIKKGRSLFDLFGSIELRRNISVKNLIKEAREEMKKDA